MALLLWAAPSSGCSTVVVGRKASATGAVLSSHSNDGDSGFDDSFLHRVKSQGWPPNSTRKVGGHDIPQVPHTFAYFTEGYAAMNEKQVGLAESTCSGRFSSPPHAPVFVNIVELGQLGLERANPSRLAVAINNGFTSRDIWLPGQRGVLVGD